MLDSIAAELMRAFFLSGLKDGSDKEGARVCVDCSKSEKDQLIQLLGEANKSRSEPVGQSQVNTNRSFLTVTYETQAVSVVLSTAAHPATPARHSTPVK